MIRITCQKNRQRFIADAIVSAGYGAPYFIQYECSDRVTVQVEHEQLPSARDLQEFLQEFDPSVTCSPVKLWL